MTGKFPEALAWMGMLFGLAYLGYYIDDLARYPSLAHFGDAVPFGGDFWQFWAAGYLVSTGQPAGPYVTGTVTAALNIVANADGSYLPLFYPPHYLLLLWPFGMIPYFYAVLAFQALGWGVLAAALWVWSRSWLVLLWASGLGALWLNVSFGQNGALTAGLVGWALWFMAKQPVAAGLVVSLLTFKPQLALPWPLLLMLQKHWRALLALFAGAGVLLVITMASFGAAIWLDFYDALQHSEYLISHSSQLWQHFTSFYPLLRTVGLDHLLALVLQLGLSLTVLSLTAYVLWRNHSPTLSLALLPATMLLAAPFAYNYDHVLLVWPLLVLFIHREVGAWRWVEWPIMMVAYLYAGITLFTRDIYPYPMGFFVVGLVWLAVVRRGLLQVRL